MNTAGMTRDRALLSLRRTVLKAHTRLRPPQSQLTPDRLYAYLDCLWRCQQVPGAIVEVGCFRGGTTRIAAQFLAETKISKRYIAIDTFKGFVDGHFQRDIDHGTKEATRSAFSRNSLPVVRRLLDEAGRENVELLEADICEMPESWLPDRISVCLLDVDLDVPTYEALRKVVARLSVGGIVLVDDCHEDNAFAGARVGYQRYVAEAGMGESYFMNMGMVSVP